MTDAAAHAGPEPDADVGRQPDRRTEAARPAARYRHLAALGSSFAAGPNIEPVEHRLAGRSAANYPHVLADLLGARLTDLTVSGATTATILTDPQRVGTGRRIRPQIQNLPADADLVTVTIGGNDLGYLGAMMGVAVNRWSQQRWFTRPLARILGGDEPPTITAADVERVADGIVAVVAAANERAPQARIVLVDYLPVVGDRTPPGLFTPADLATFRAIAGQLSTAYGMAALRSDAGLITPGMLGAAGHVLGTPHPWVTDFRPSMRPLPFHPTADGMRAVADAVYRYVIG